MLDYNRIREDAISRRRELSETLSQNLERQRELQEEIEKIRRELATIDDMLAALDFLRDGPPLEGEPKRTADQVRHTLQQTSVYLLPTQLRDLLLAAGVNSTSPKNLLIAVHNVLSRLKPFLESKEVNRRTAYRWKRPRQ